MFDILDKITFSYQKTVKTVPSVIKRGMCTIYSLISIKYSNVQSGDLKAIM